MKTMSKFLALIFLLAFNAGSFANTAYLDSLKLLYDKGEFEQAEQLLQEQFNELGEDVSAGLHYNMGNVMLKQNKIGEAIFHYESALRRSPFNEDIQHNLEMAQKKVRDEFEKVPEFSTYPFFIRINYWLDVLWLGILGIFLCLLALVTVIKYKILDRALVPSYWKWMLFGGLFLVLWANIQAKVISSNVIAVVTSNTANIQSEPNELSKALFTLSSGVTLRVINEDQQWLNVKLPNGSKGWVKSEEVKMVK